MKFDIVLICLSFFISVCLSQVKVTRINDGDLYAYTDNFYFGMFLITPKGVIAIDAPPNIVGSMGKTIPELISEYTDKPVKWFIYSHHHLDHVGTAGDFKGNVEFICHKKASKQIKSSGLPPCTTIVSNDGMELKIDNSHSVQLNYYGLIHTDGNLFIYVPHYKTLMVVDVVYPGWVPYHGLGFAGGLFNTEKALNKIMEYDFKYYVGGHWDRIGNKTDVTIYQNFFNDLKTSVKKAMKKVSFAEVIEEVGMTETNRLTVFRTYTDQIVDKCVDRMTNELKWGDILLDLSSYIDTHCMYVYEVLTVNY